MVVSVVTTHPDLALAYHIEKPMSEKRKNRPNKKSKGLVGKLISFTVWIRRIETITTKSVKDITRRQEKALREILSTIREKKEMNGLGLDFSFENRAMLLFMFSFPGDRNHALL